MIRATARSRRLQPRARSRCSPARFRVGSFVSEPILDCDAVLAIGELFNYRFHAAGTEETLGSLKGFQRLVGDRLSQPRATNEDGCRLSWCSTSRLHGGSRRSA